MNSQKMNNFQYSLLIYVLILVCLTMFSELCFAFHPGTHSAINEYISKSSAFDDYLKNQLGIKSGVESEVYQKKIWELFRDGGANEDSGIRSLNHFHNPLTNEGLSGQYSALTWAIGKEYRSSYSWYDVRDYYFQALTASDKANRDYWFAQTFQGLGQVMHLVQDMSIPAHVRHKIFYLGPVFHLEV